MYSTTDYLFDEIIFGENFEPIIRLGDGEANITRVENGQSGVGSMGLSVFNPTLLLTSLAGEDNYNEFQSVGLNHSFTRRSLETQQQPTTDVDIIGLGTKYMMGQMAESKTSSRKLVKLGKRDVDCGPGSPCKDGSCCNSQGRCGYGDA